MALPVAAQLLALAGFFVLMILQDSWFARDTARGMARLMGPLLTASDGATGSTRKGDIEEVLARLRGEQRRMALFDAARAEIGHTVEPVPEWRQPGVYFGTGQLIAFETITDPNGQPVGSLCVVHGPLDRPRHEGDFVGLGGASLLIWVVGASWLYRVVRSRILAPAQQIAALVRQFDRDLTGLDVPPSAGDEELAHACAVLGAIRSAMEAQRQEDSHHAATLERTATWQRAELERLRSELVTQQRMSNVSPSVAEAIRTPLEWIRRLSMELHASTALPAAEARVASEIAAGTEELLRLVTELHDMALLEAGQLDLRAEVFAVLPTLRTALDAAKLDAVPLHAAPGVPRSLVGDPLRIAQLVQFHASALARESTLSRVLLSWREDLGAGKVRIELEHVPARANLGGPRPPHHANTSGLLRLLNGVTGQINPADGTEACLWIEIPLTSPAARPPAQSEHPTQSEDKQSAETQTSSRVLLVEDNPVNQRVARKMLERFGLQVELADNGRLAVERLAVDRFDLILMDCQMPELDGYQATRVIRQRELEGTPRHIIVALTANAMVGDRETCLAAGMDDYLSKPLRVEQLRGMLDKWLCESPQQFVVH